MAMTGAHVSLSAALASALCEQAPWMMEETRREQWQSTFLIGVLRNSFPRHPTSSFPTAALTGSLKNLVRGDGIREGNFVFSFQVSGAAA